LFENALKLTYGNVEFKKFHGEDPRIPASRGGRGAGRVEAWGGRGGGGGGGEGRGGRKGRVEGKGGREGLKEKEGKERGEKRGREGERNSDLQCSRQIDATVLKLISGLRRNI
jgi:hypothetical protein